jgi:hypothetical protein
VKKKKEKQKRCGEHIRVKSLYFYVKHECARYYYFLLLTISCRYKKKEIMSSSSVSPKKRGVSEDELSKMQKQMEFMFGEMMSRFEDRFEKLETKVESRLGKKSREARKKESVAGNSTEGAEDDFNRGSEFRTHRNDLDEARPRRARIQPDRDSGHRRNFDDLGDVDRNLGSIKLKIPAFKGKTDPEAYSEWERKVEMIFYIHRYSEEKNVKLVVVEFTNYAMVWWERLVVERRRNRERPVSTWEGLKTIMKKRYVSKHYYRELFNRLQMIT